MRVPANLLQSLLKFFSVFKMRIWYEKNTVHKKIPDTLGIKFINCGKVVVFTLDNLPVEYFINVFIKNLVYQYVCLSWIIELKK